MHAGPLAEVDAVYGLIGDDTIAADVPSDVKPAVSETVSPVLDQARVHAFDFETEAAL